MTITPEVLKPTLVERAVATIKRLADGINRALGRMTSDEYVGGLFLHRRLLSDVLGDSSGQAFIQVDRRTGTTLIRARFNEADAEAYAAAAGMELRFHNDDHITLTR